MSDGEDLENQEPRIPPKRSLKDIFGGPPVEPRITEPEPDEERESLEDKSSPNNPQETQEVLFRESAKRLAKEELEIYDLAREHGILPILQSPDFTIDLFNDFVSLNIRTKDIGRENLAYGGIKETPIHFSYYPSDHSINLSGDIGVNAKCDLRIGVYSDIDTRDKFLNYAESAPGYGNPSSIYYFSENGDYGKLQQTNPELESGKEYLPDRSYGDKRHQRSFKSKMTPEDFELAGRALGLLKGKLLTALGRDPEEPQTPQ